MSLITTFEGIQRESFGKFIIPTVIETMRLFPDAIVIASGIYAIIIQSMPYGVFFGTMIEATVIYNLIKSFATYVNITGTIIPTAESNRGECRSGFVNPISLNYLSFFGDSPIGIAFPSAPIYTLSVASAYIFTTLNHQSKELQALGPSYASRYYSSIFFLFMIIFVFILFRLFFNCESFGVMFMSVIIGLVIGVLLVRQNVRLFGPQSINLIGIPLLRNRTADGKKLYVCPK